MADYYGSLGRLLSSFKDKMGLQNLIPGTKAYQIAESIAYEETIVEAKIDDYAIKNSILTATGEDLDRIGFNVFGTSRLGEQTTAITNSMKVLKFFVEVGVFGDINRGVNGLPQDITIPKGISVSGSIDGINYVFSIDQEYVLGQNESEKYVSAILVQGDTTLIPSNTLTSHSFINYSTGISKLLKITNPSPISTGRQEESDDNYRYRISNAVRSHISTTYYGIENTLLQVPGVSSVSILNATAGGGSFTVFVQGTTPITSDDVITRCDRAIADFVPPWVTYNVFKPYYVGIECIINVIVRETSDSIVSNVVNSVASLINNFGGTQLYLNTILQQAQLSDSNILDVSFDMLRKHYGSDEYRTYEDLLTDANPILSLYELEKLIVEPIPNAIMVNQIV